jgi:hypothetical protein
VRDCSEKPEAGKAARSRTCNKKPDPSFGRKAWWKRGARPKEMLNMGMKEDMTSTMERLDYLLVTLKKINFFRN